MRTFAYVIAIAITIAAIGCSDDIVIPEPNFVLESKLTNPILVQVKKPLDRVQKGETVVGISVRHVRVLVSRVILHAQADTSGKNDRTIKAGPFVYEADSLGSRVITSINVAPGTYDRLKFELHRFSSSETAPYENDPTFQDFVTGDRYTVIIDGFVVRKNGAMPFSYKSDVTSNLDLEYSPALVIGEGAITASSITFDVASVFKDGADILDPADASNRSFIDNGIKRAFRTGR